MENRVVLETKNLKVLVKEKEKVINYDNLQFYEGEFVNIVGSNGAGKSTFLKVLMNEADYCSIEAGEVLLNGKNIFKEYSYSELHKSVVNIGQDDNEAFKTNESAFKALVRPAIVACPTKKDEIYRLAFEYYKDFIFRFFNSKHGISEQKLEQLKNNPKKDFKFMYSRVSNLSGGQQKMIHILQGLIKAQITASSLILMDEPLNNLDKENKKILIGLINKIREENPLVTILTITHCKVFNGVRSLLEIKENGDEFVANIERFSDDIKTYDCLK